MSTSRFGIPLLSSGQAQKEVTHNEAIQALELLLQPIVEGPPNSNEPTSPAVGQQFIVGDEPSGRFQGEARAIATWTEAGWIFSPSFVGLAAVDRSSGQTWRFNGQVWQLGIVEGARVNIGGEQVVGARQPAISAPAGGSVIDNEARSVLGAVLVALRQHGLIAS